MSKEGRLDRSFILVSLLSSLSTFSDQVMHMFGAILRTQWKWCWTAVLGCAVVAFAIPLISVQNAAIPMTELTRGIPAAEQFLLAIERWGPLYTALAAMLGLTLAMLSWSADHRGRHVYALSLPIPRWRYVLMRFGSGAMLVLLPTATLLAGALLATAATQIPDGLVAR
jgi:hypothetical protein